MRSYTYSSEEISNNNKTVGMIITSSQDKRSLYKTEFSGTLWKLELKKNTHTFPLKIKRWGINVTKYKDLHTETTNTAQKNYRSKWMEKTCHDYGLQGSILFTWQFSLNQ